MAQHYHQITIPNLEAIQSQVLSILGDWDSNREVDMVFTNRQGLDEYNQILQITELQDFLIANGLDSHVMDIVIAIMDPDSEMILHNDPTYTDETTGKTSNHRRVLIPIENCDGSTTTFYTTDQTPEQRIARAVDGSELPYWYYDPALCTPTESFNLTQPTLIHTEPVHGVVNNSNGKKINLWILLDNEVDIQTQFNWV